MALNKNSFAALILLCFSPLAIATWYQGTAQQELSGLNYDLDSIRTSTIKQAITNASLKSGVYVSSESIVLDGLLQSSKNVFKHKGDIRRVEILSETISGDRLTVIVNVDIKPMIHCKQDGYLKSVTIAQFPFVNSMPLIHSDLFNLGSQITRRLSSQLSQNESIAEPQRLDESFTSTSALKALDLQNIDKVSHHLATKYGNQFIVFGYIQDVGLFEQVKDNLLIDDVSLRRNFTIQLYLYDAWQNSLLINKRYHGEANWTFDNHEKLDTNNSVFWRSDYGRIVLNTLSNAVIDINDSITCQKSLIQIVHKNQNEAIINLGTKHGVKAGDEFSLIRRKLSQNHQEQTFPMLILEENSTLRVKHASYNHTVLISDDPSFINSSQINDLVTPKGILNYD